jgi:DNA-binding transcriptional MocR family regulator
MFRLTRGVPADEAIPQDLIAEACAKALRRFGPKLLQYDSSQGFTPLREVLADRIGASPREILIGNGSLQLFSTLCSTYLVPGDAVIVERPTYDRALEVLRRIGVRIVGVPIQDDGVDCETMVDLVNFYRPRMLYLIPDFQNPTGITISSAKRYAIAELAAKYNIIIVEDIPYRMLRYIGEQEPSFREISPETTIQLSSFSKLICPGIRVGWMCGPSEIITHLTKYLENVYITPNMLGQGIAYEFLINGWLEQHLENIKRLYYSRLLAAIQSLKEFFSGEGKWIEPQGGFFIGLWLSQDVDMFKVYQYAETMGLILSRGEYFFSDDPDNFVRIPFASLKEHELFMAIKTLAGILKQLKEGKNG